MDIVLDFFFQKKLKMQSEKLKMKIRGTNLQSFR